MTKLAALRQQLGLTQHELAHALDISHSALAMYEVGLRVPRLQRALRMAEFFQVSIPDLGFGERREER